MKKLIVMGIVAVMVMGLSVAASAALDNTWMMQLRAADAAGVSLGTVTIGTKVGATDGYTTTGSEDGVVQTPPAARAMLVSTIVAGQLTTKDVRAPLVVGQTKTWDLTLYEYGGGATTFSLTGWMASSANMLDLSTGGDPNIKVELKQGDKVLWTVPYGVSGSSTAPTFTLATPLSYTGNAISLQVVASTVPEPGSMVALFSGLIGLVGFGIRRRK